ncbi:helix-turn-helix domain-containing protein [Helicobacter sp. 11S02596-1]|uniref:helix-turn-helix domain-containing protein n=1 Tax=Helicobacter sp. 11S02596-1 TaxID=1476194 RepID=UPI000BA6F9FA|nr:helix-turn-helix domain-containing protein [Helicobacter sp. 11S02596-1]PAF41074.1 hypothetical protein BJI48_09115 [Helicobacter sp. 11S02596-1]
MQNNYSKLPNHIITNKNLSRDAKALFWYIASRPIDWDFSNKDIQETLGFKHHDTIAKYLKELLNSGYVQREKIQNEAGKFTGKFKYFISLKNEATECLKIDPTQSLKIDKKQPPECLKNRQLTNNILFENINYIYKKTKAKKENFNSNHSLPKGKSKNESIKNEILALPLGENIPKDLWSEFVACRLEKKKGFSVRAAKMLLNKLEGFSLEDVSEAMRESIINSWDSVYVKTPHAFSRATNTKSRPASHRQNQSQYIDSELRKQGIYIQDVAFQTKSIPLVDGKEVVALRDYEGKYFLRFK